MSCLVLSITQPFRWSGSPAWSSSWLALRYWLCLIFFHVFALLPFTTFVICDVKYACLLALNDTNRDLNLNSNWNFTLGYWLIGYPYLISHFTHTHSWSLKLSLPLEIIPTQKAILHLLAFQKTTLKTDWPYTTRKSHAPHTDTHIHIYIFLYIK